MLRALLTALLLATISCQSLTLQPNNLTINHMANYTVTVSRAGTNVFPQTGKITLTFPTKNYQNSQLAGTTCQPACTIKNTTVEWELSVVSTRNSSMTILITAVKNPPSCCETDPFTYRLLDSNNLTVESRNLSLFGLIPGTLQQCLISFSPGQLDTVSTATFALTLGNPIPPNGSIYVRLPSKWSQSASSSSLVNTNSYLTCRTDPSSNMTCFCDSFTQPTITISKATTTISGTIKISIDNFLSPPTSANLTQIYLSSGDQYDLMIDNETGCTISSLSPTVFTTSILPQNAKVSTAQNVNISYSVVSGILTNDVLQITWLPTYTNFSISSINLITTEQNLNFTRQISIESSNGSVFRFRLPSLTGKSAVSKNSQITLTNLTVVTPPNTKSAQLFNITFLRQESSYSTALVSYISTTSTITNISITADNSLINQKTSFSINMTISSLLTNKGSITLKIPDSVYCQAYAKKSCVFATINNTNTTAMCSITNNLLTISDMVSIPSKTSLNIKFSGVTNPSSVKPAGPFVIQTYYNEENFNTDIDSSAYYTAKADTITDCSISRNNFTMGTAAQYTIVYRNRNPLPQNVTLIIVLPAQITMPTVNPTVTVNGQSYPVAFTNTSITINCQFSTSLSTNTTITIVIVSLMNPRNTGNTSSFSLSALDGGFLVQSITQGLIVTGGQPNSFKRLQISRSSNRNGQPNRYTILASPSLDYSGNCYLQLTLPDTITASSITCHIDTTTLNCSYSSNSIWILIDRSLNSSLTYNISINNLINPRNFTTSANFTLTSYIADRTATIDNSSHLGMTNTDSNFITNVTRVVVQPTQSYLDSNQSTYFSVTTTNGLLTTDVLQVTFPKEYTYVGTTNQSICLESGVSCIPSAVNNSIVEVKGTFSDKIINFTIGQYRSPSSLANLTVFNFSSWDSVNRIIDVVSSQVSLTFELSCFLPCRTCLTTNMSFCLSCYSNSTEKVLQNGTCLSTCQTGYYYDGAVERCFECVDPCNTCGSLTQCYTCKQNSLNSSFFPGNGTCVMTCPDGTFSQLMSSGYICNNCSSHCLTCNGTASTCLSCPTGAFLLGTQCLTACPDRTYRDKILQSCTDCDASCSKCEDSSNFCLVCAIDKYSRLYSGGPCVLDCGPLNVSVSGQCQCQEKCKTCSAVVNNCTTCHQGSISHIYYRNDSNQMGYCLSACPVGTYLNSVSCSQCLNGCLNCQSALVCTLCNSSLYLYNASCLNSCPLGTFPDAKQNCVDCLASKCITCLGNAEYCTECVNGLIAFNGNCIVTCPQNTLLVNRSCISCQEPCLRCVDVLTKCINCISGYFFLNDSCWSTCPTGYFGAAGQCQLCREVCQTCNNKLECTSCKQNQSFKYLYKNEYGQMDCTDNCSLYDMLPDGRICIEKVYDKVVPMPFLLLLTVGGVVTAISWWRVHQTKIVLMMLAIVSLLETLCWITGIGLVGVTYEAGAIRLKVGLWCLVGGLFLQLFSNAISVFFFKKYMIADSDVGRWWRHHSGNGFKCLFYGSHAVNLKSFNLFLCKAFGHTVCRLEFTHPSRIIPFLVASGLTLLPETMYFAGGLLVCLDEKTNIKTQLFMSMIDGLVISLLTATITIITFRRELGPDTKNFTGKQANEEEINPHWKHHQNPNYHDQTEQAMVEPGGRSLTYLLTLAGYEQPQDHNEKPLRRKGDDDDFIYVKREEKVKKQLHMSQSSSQVESEQVRQELEKQIRNYEKQSSRVASHLGHDPIRRHVIPRQTEDEILDRSSEGEEAVSAMSSAQADESIVNQLLSSQVQSKTSPREGSQAEPEKPILRLKDVKEEEEVSQLTGYRNMDSIEVGSHEEMSRYSSNRALGNLQGISKPLDPDSGLEPMPILKTENSQQQLSQRVDNHQDQTYDFEEEIPAKPLIINQTKRFSNLEIQKGFSNHVSVDEEIDQIRDDKNYSKTIYGMFNVKRGGNSMPTESQDSIQFSELRPESQQPLPSESQKPAIQSNSPPNELFMLTSTSNVPFPRLLPLNSAQNDVTNSRIKNMEKIYLGQVGRQSQPRNQSNPHRQTRPGQRRYFEV